jgi:hypothetical protein
MDYVKRHCCDVYVYFCDMNCAVVGYNKNKKNCITVFILQITNLGSINKLQITPFTALYWLKLQKLNYKPRKWKIKITQSIHQLHLEHHVDSLYLFNTVTLSPIFRLRTALSLLLRLKSQWTGQFIYLIAVPSMTH